MKVEIWSDVVCPWCYVGKREFENAMSRFPHRDGVEVDYRSFQLNPGASKKSMLRSERSPPSGGAGGEERHNHVVQRAAAVGIEFHYDKVMTGNTFDAHRLIHLASEYGKQNEAEERFMKAVFVDGLPISDRDTLVRLASEIGLDPKEARVVLDSDLYADEVRSDESMAQSIGVNGVPFFVIDSKYGVSGAQSSESFLAVLEKVWSESHPLLKLEPKSGETDSCEGDSCPVT